jgi:hypothetical protein
MHKAQPLSEIMAMLEGSPEVDSIQVQAWKSIRMVHIVIEMKSGATCSSLYSGPDFKTLTIFDPSEMDGKTRQTIAATLINDHNETQTKVAKILRVSQATISLEMKLLGEGIHRTSTKMRRVTRKVALKLTSKG